MVGGISILSRRFRCGELFRFAHLKHSPPIPLALRFGERPPGRHDEPADLGEAGRRVPAQIGEFSDRLLFLVRAIANDCLGSSGLRGAIAYVVRRSAWHRFHAPRFSYPVLRFRTDSKRAHRRRGSFICCRFRREKVGSRCVARLRRGRSTSVFLRESPGGRHVLGALHVGRSSARGRFVIRSLQAVKSRFGVSSDKFVPSVAGSERLFVRNQWLGRPRGKFDDDKERGRRCDAAANAHPTGQRRAPPNDGGASHAGLHRAGQPLGGRHAGKRPDQLGGLLQRANLLAAIRAARNVPFDGFAVCGRELAVHVFVQQVAYLFTVHWSSHLSARSPRSFFLSSSRARCNRDLTVPREQLSASPMLS